jgi:hypothetical protein
MYTRIDCTYCNTQQLAFENMVPVDFTHAFETVIASKIFISFLLGKCNIYFNMKTSKIYESDNKWCIGILVLLVVHIHFVVCGKVRNHLTL